MSATTLSVVIPAWNAERYLDEALDSVLAQLPAAAEVVVVDDGSTDRTADLARRRGDPVRCLRQEHRGAPAARNAGIRHARGDLLAFLDADDLWLPGKIDRQLEQLSGRPSLGAVTTRLRDFWIPELVPVAASDGNPRDGLVTQTGVVRRSAFERVGLLDEDLPHHDAQAWELRARTAGVEIERLADVLALRRIHLDNLSRRRSPESPDALARLLQRIRKEGRI